MNAKVDELKVGDIFVARDFVDVFLKYFLGLAPQRQVEFRIDLVHEATSVAKSPYRLAPLEMQELSEQLRELQDKDAAKSVRDAIGLSTLASQSDGQKSPVLWAEIGESSLIGHELVQETTDKVVLIKEGQSVSPFRKGVIRFGKKGKLAPRTCLADASLHVPLDEIKVDKTLRFVEEPVETRMGPFGS
ncbi:hypothetical protein Tco_1438517 [Tanacetum coccineum]